MNEIPLAPLDTPSSLIAEHGYDEGTQTLAVKFKKTAEVFHYSNVTPAQYEAFLKSESPGKFFHSEFRARPDDHPFQGFDPDAEEES